MMLTNAAIVRIDAPRAIAADNDRAPFVNGPATCLRGSWQRPRTGQKWVLGAEISNASAMFYAPGNVSSLVSPEGRIAVLVDGENSSREYLVLAVEPQVGGGGGGLTNTEIYLERAGN